MKLNRTGANWDRLERNKINENWDIIEGSHNKLEDEFDDVVGKITDEVVGHLIDSARLDWKGPVDTVEDLPANAEVGETRMVREADPDGISYVYRYDGEKWEKIQAIDVTLVNEVDKRLTRQLADTTQKTDTMSNAVAPLYIATYEGYDQVVHPSVEYFEDGFAGHKYWMAYTPYPWTNDFYENPSIAVSDDGIVWKSPEGLINPIDEVTEEEHNNGEHFSDTELVFNPNTGLLECWYRWRNKNTGLDRFYRKTSSDGIVWENKELLYESSNLSLSPTIIYEDNKYRMWYVVSKDNYSLAYRESIDGKNWTNEQLIPLNFGDIDYARIWHVHIYKENSGLYHITFNERNASLYWGTSTDGMSFNVHKKILSPLYYESSWDNREIYRSSLTKVDGVYKLYYSARGLSPNRWHIGLSEGLQMTSLVGSKNIDRLGYKAVPRQRGGTLEYEQVRSPYIFGDHKDAQVRLRNPGVNGARLVLGDKSDQFKIVGDNGTTLGNLNINELILGHIFGTGGSSGLSLYDLVRVLDENGNPPRLKILHRGKYGVTLTIDDPDVVKVRGDNESNPGHLEVGSLLLNGEGFKQRNGAIRYNDVSTKFQGFVPSQGWANLNNYVSTVPASSTSGGNRGDYTTDDNYLYVCHRPNNWFRFPKDTW